MLYTLLHEINQVASEVKGSAGVGTDDVKLAALWSEIKAVEAVR